MLRIPVYLIKLVREQSWAIVAFSAPISHWRSSANKLEQGAVAQIQKYGRKFTPHQNN